MKNTSASRRDFLKAGAAACSLATLAPSLVLAAAEPTPEATHNQPNRNYLGKNARLTISMWDFSWLHASHPGGAYENLERCVAEARERGYNTLRVDCFPSRIPEDESTFEKNWSPGQDLPHWGERSVTFSCNVRKKVIELANLCRKHDIWLGLDSWDKGHMFDRSTKDLGGTARKFAAADEEKEFTRYGETWVKALKLLREDGVLERAVWIAPMNEVPHFAGGHLIALSELHSQPRSKGDAEAAKNQQENEIYRRINHWMAAPIRAEVAREKIPISYSSLGTEDYAKRLTE